MEPVDRRTPGRARVDDPEAVTAVEFRHRHQETVDIRPFGIEIERDDFVITHAVFIHLSF